MKRHVGVVLLVVLAIATAGCGAGSDVSFSPDPTVADVSAPPPSGSDVPGGTDGEVVTTDCFENGFCTRACVSVSDCPAGFSCILKVCTFDCQADAECGTGGRCNDQGLCEAASAEPLPLCTQDADCGDGRYCTDEGACEKTPAILGCNRDSECPLGQYCDEVHQCQLYPGAGVDCSIDADCPGESYCDALNRCHQDCRTDQQCAANEACSAFGKCVVPGAPAKLTTFTFTALGADTDPTGPVRFTSPSFVIQRAEIVPAGRSETLTSQRFRLVGSAGF